MSKPVSDTPLTKAAWESRDSLRALHDCCEQLEISLVDLRTRFRKRIEWEDSIKARLEEENLVLERDRARFAEALRQIEAWNSFPRVPDPNLIGATISYAAAYGSNGQRDFMRAIARTALASLNKEEK